MPLIHTRTFRVRHYECGPEGWVLPANYLRYMQEAAFDASAAAGYDLARYQVMGSHWLVRETEIDYLHPLRYGDTFELKTWVADFRRVRSRRAYEFRLALMGTPVARASTDWVFLDTATERPASIPEEMKAAFFPEGLLPPAEPRERFPDLLPPRDAFRQRRRVERRDLDQAGHVNNAVYVTYVDECGRQWAATQDRAVDATLLPWQHRLEYLLPAFLDDELELVTWSVVGEDGQPARYTWVQRAADATLLARSRSLEQWVTGLRPGPRGRPAIAR